MVTTKKRTTKKSIVHVRAEAAKHGAKVHDNGSIIICTLRANVTWSYHGLNILCGRYCAKLRDHFHWDKNDVCEQLVAQMALGTETVEEPASEN